MLIRALLYRITTDNAALEPPGWAPDQLAAYQPVAARALTYAERSPT